jgi:hypothetical protein
MRPLQTLRNSLQHISSTARITNSQSAGLRTPEGAEGIASRHDAQLLTGRSVPRDPYVVWLEQRKTEREREERRLNPRNAWDDLRTQSFCALGRG